MSRIDSEMADDLISFARGRAEAGKLSLEAYIEILIGLESGIRECAAIPRTLARPCLSR